jgi:hypothetical protein
MMTVTWLTVPSWNVRWTAGMNLWSVFPRVLVEHAVFVAHVQLVVQEGDHERVLHAVALRVRGRRGVLHPWHERIPQERPGAGAVHEGVVGSQHRQCLVRGELPVDPGHRAGVAGLDELAQRPLDDVERHEPLRPHPQQLPQVTRHGASIGQAGLKLGVIEDGLDILAVDYIRPIALDRVRDEVRREGDHSRTGVRGATLVDPHRRPIDGLEEGREEQADGAGSHDVDDTSGANGLKVSGHVR